MMVVTNPEQPVDVVDDQPPTALHETHGILLSVERHCRNQYKTRKYSLSKRYS